MQELDFYLDGESANANGIGLQKPISFTGATPRIRTVQLAGRSGDLHIDLHSYENREGVARCFVLAENAVDKMGRVLGFLFGSTKGYRKLRTSDDPFHYWEARIANAGDISARLSLLNPFSITFDCKPFRRLVGGDSELICENGAAVYNPTGFEAQPIVHFSSTDEGAITIGDYYIPIGGGVTNGVIDSEELYASAGASIDEYPTLKAGYNYISWSGGAVVDNIIPRWRSL